MLASRTTPAGEEPRRSGFSLLELLIVVTVGAILMSFAALSVSSYVSRAAPERAAQVFARDLSMARSAALRAREPVVIRFYEDSRWYQIAMLETGTELLRRRFGVNGDIRLTEVDLRMRGDTVLFTSRGLVDMKNAFGALGEARFSSDAYMYTVYFNALGASKVEGSEVSGPGPP